MKSYFSTTEKPYCRERGKTPTALQTAKRYKHHNTEGL